ncbi:MAG TPA: FUSC family protein, partial [Streptosporangiaceae bacterium]|nr:FUSC family protein [Streptosporangiaceae bacterium]
MSRWFRSISPLQRAGLRAGACLGFPLLTGLLTGQRLVFMMAAVGAVWVLAQDGVDRWRDRRPRMVSAALASGLGIFVGAAAAGAIHAAWLSWLVIALAAVAAGWLEAGMKWAAAGMQFLLGVIVGGGLATSRAPWVFAVAVAAGGLLVVLAAMSSDHRNRSHDRRSVVADTFDALAALVGCPGPADAAAARRRAITALNVAEDAVSDVPGCRRLPGRAAAQPATACFAVALQVAEAAATLPGLASEDAPVLAGVLVRAARLLRAGSEAGALTALSESGTALAARARTPAQSCRARALLPPPEYPARWAPRPVRPGLPARERARFAVLLAGACVLAAAIGHVMHGPRAYWLPLTVAFVMRPDLGPVIRRGAERTAGTLAGVAAAALIGLLTRNDYALLGFGVICVSMLPAAARRGHMFVVSSFTPIVFVLLALVGKDEHVLVPRVVDTIVGAGIVMIVDLLCWTRAPSLRPAAQIDRAEAAAGAYVSAVPKIDPGWRHLLRREAFRAVAHARLAVQLASAEPHPSRRPQT